MHDGMQYDLIQGQGHEPFKVGNLAIFKSYMLSFCVRLSVCQSVTSRTSTKMAKLRITQTTSYDSSGTLVF